MVSKRHRGECLGVDAVGYGMVSLVVFPQAVESNALDHEVDALVPTRSDENVEKDTVILSAGMEQKAPRSVSWRCDETTSAMVKLAMKQSLACGAPRTWQKAPRSVS